MVRVIANTLFSALVLLLVEYLFFERMSNLFYAIIFNFPCDLVLFFLLKSEQRTKFSDFNFCVRFWSLIFVVSLFLSSGIGVTIKYLFFYTLIILLKSILSFFLYTFNGDNSNGIK